MNKIVARPDLKEDTPIIVAKDVCDQCGSCIAICSPNCITLESLAVSIESDECIRCGFCLHACPVEALRWRDDGVIIVDKED